MGFRDKRTWVQHWPVVLLGILVALIFLMVLVAFEVKETEHAIVMTFGEPKAEVVDGVTKTKLYDPGLHWKWPYPIDTVWRHDNRLQCYELKRGQVEQIQTADDYQIVVTTYVLWRIDKDAPELFLKRLNTTANAEEVLDKLTRHHRNIALGRHKLSELINVDPEKVRIDQVADEILASLQADAKSNYGIEVTHLGFKHLGFPEKVSAKVIARMKAERNRKSAEYRAEGKRDAEIIRARADLEVRELLAKAEGEAKLIRAEGDKTAAQYYAVFRKNPELAAFLRKLDALRLTLSEKTTLVLDTNTPPYDLLRRGATKLGKLSLSPQSAPPKAGGAK